VNEPVDSAIRLGDGTKRSETLVERLWDYRACRGSVVDSLACVAPVAAGAVVYLRDEVSYWMIFRF
jgi:hypothetical protein